MPGEGSIYKRIRKRPPDPEHPDRPPQEYTRWIAQVSYGPRHDRRVVRRVRRTKGEAKKALDEMLGPQQSTRLLVDWLHSWLDDTAAPSLAPNTTRGYRAVIASLKAIHDIPLADLAPEDIEAALRGLTAQRRGQEHADPASPKTKRNALAMLRRSLGVAQRRGYVVRNVAMLVDMPRVPRVSRPALTPATAKAVMKATAKDRYAAAYALALCGLRLGEVLGLAWEDLDLDAGTVDVRYQAVGSGKKARRAQLKTASSEAPIALPPFVVRRLEAHRREQRKERLANGWPQVDEGHVFITTSGYVVNGSWLSKHFGDLLVEAGLPKLRFHDLRHGAATLLGAAGVHPRVAQEYLRHSQVGTTLNVYTAVARGRDREAADALEAMVG